MATESTSLFRARFPASRLRKAEETLARLVMKPGEVWFTELGMVEKSRPVLVGCSSIF